MYTLYIYMYHQNTKAHWPGCYIAPSYRKQHLLSRLNRFRHCCTYDDLEGIDTIANDQLEKAKNNPDVILSNFVQGVFVQAAADNDDLVEEHATHLEHATHATKLVLYKRNSNPPAMGSFAAQRSSSSNRPR